MPTIRISGSKPGQQQPVNAPTQRRGVPLLDPLAWNRSLNQIERSLARLVGLQSGTTAAVGGIRTPRMFQEIERDLRRLITQSERAARAGGYQTFRPLPPGSPAWIAAMGGGRGGGGRGGLGAFGPAFPIIGPPGRGRGGRVAGGGLGGAGGGGGGGGGAAPGFLGPLRGLLGSGGMRALGRLGVAGGVAEVIYKIMTAPQEIAHLEQRALSAAEPFMNYIEHVHDISRAGGFRGMALSQQQFRIGAETPEWMKLLGVGPNAALESISRYGIVPRSAREQTDTAYTLSTLARSPAYSGMAPGTVEATAGHAQALGYRGLAFTAYQSRVLEDAIAKGMDRARVLSTIEESLDQIAGSGAVGLTGQSTMDMLARMFSSGIPGARTGVLQQQTIGGLEGAIGTLGTDPVRTMMMYQAMAKGGLKNQDQLRGFLGGDTYDQINRTPEGKFILGAITDEMAAGRPATAMMYLRQALSSNPARFQEIMKGQIPNIGGSKALGALVESQVTGMPLTAVLANRFGTGTSGVGARTGAFMEGVDIATGVKGAGGFDPDYDYAGALARANIPQDLIASFIATGRKYNISPLVLASLAQTENAKFDPTFGYSTPKAGVGVGQILGSTAAPYGVSRGELTDPATNIDVMGHYLSDLRDKTGSVLGAVGKYGPQTPGGPETEQNRFMSNLGRMTGVDQLPETYRQRVSGEEQALAGSFNSFLQFGSRVEGANTALAGFTKEILRLSAIIASIGRPTGPAMTYP